MIGLLASIKSGVTTLTGRLTSGRATALDNLDAAITTRLGSIKSIQRGSITVTHSGAGSTSNTATITSVTTSKSVILKLGHTCNSDIAQTRVELTNGTTVTAYSTVIDGNATVTVDYQVVEFN